LHTTKHTLQILEQGKGEKEIKSSKFNTLNVLVATIYFFSTRIRWKKIL